MVNTMNKLSTEIKAKEIHENAQFWHNRAEHNLYRFFLEVKKIRDERLFSELGFTNFDEYCQSAWNLKRRVVDERIQIADTFSEDDFKRYSAQLGHKKTLLLTSMEEPQREKTLTEGIPTEQGYKPYDEATQKEIADYKRNAEEMERKAKEYERQLETKNELISKREKENEILQSKLEDAENAPPKVIYKERVETVVPDDYVKLKRDSERFKAISDSQENKNIKLQQEIDQLKREISNVDEKSKKYDQLNEEINKMNGRLTEGQLRIKNQKLVYDLVKKSEALISEVAPLTYSISHLGVDDNKYAKEPLIKIAENLEDISSRIRKQLNENKIIEVE